LFIVAALFPLLFTSSSLSTLSLLLYLSCVNTLIYSCGIFWCGIYSCGMYSSSGVSVAALC